MSIVTYLACDHCGIENTKSGVGNGNIGGVDVEADLPLASKSKQHIGGHLCIDCQKKIFNFLKDFGI